MAASKNEEATIRSRFVGVGWNVKGKRWQVTIVRPMQKTKRQLDQCTVRSGLKFSPRFIYPKVRITTDGKRKYLGMFQSEEEAARRYDEVASQTGRPVNFPVNEAQFKARKVERCSSEFRGVTHLREENMWKVLLILRTEVSRLMTTC